MDSMQSKWDSFCSKTDLVRLRQHSPHLLLQVLADSTTEEHRESDMEKEEMDEDGNWLLRQMSKHLIVMKDRTMLVDSEAFVDTQNSRLQQPSLLLHSSWSCYLVPHCLL